MSRLIFDADTLGGTTTLSSVDSVDNFVITVPAETGIMALKSSSNDATFRNITLTGAVLAGAWNGSTIGVPYGGTGTTTLTGYVKGNGTSAMTASATIPNTDITGLGTMSTQDANNVTITGGQIYGLNSAIPVLSGGTGVTTLTGLAYGNGTSAFTAASAAQIVAAIGLTYVSNANFATSSTSSTTATNIAGGAAGSIPYQNGVGSTALLAKGTNGQVLSLVSGFPAWTTVSGAGTVTSVDGSGGTTGLTLTGGPITSSGTLTLGGTLAVANGGTGSATAADARTALGLGTMATQAASSVAITGGSINGTSLGATTAGSAKVTTLDIALGLTLATAAGASGQVLTSAGAGAVPTWTTPATGTVTSVTGTAPVVSSGGATPAISMAAANGSTNGYLTSTDWTTFNSKGSGTVTSVAGTGTVNGLTLTGTVTSSGSLTLGGTLSLVSPPAIGTTTPAEVKATTGWAANLALTDAATVAWDTSTSQVATFTFVSSNRTMGAPTNLKNGAFYALAVIQNGGSNTLTWNSVFKWAAGTAPTLSTAAGAKDYFTFRSDGVSLFQQGISQAVS